MAGDYHTWRETGALAAGGSYRVATKPGLLGSGGSDVATMLLVEHARVAPGETVVQMHGATGLFGAVAAGSAARVLLADRSVLSIEAARRTLAANGATNASVHLGHGARVLPAGVQADLVVIRIPTEKVALHQLLWDAFALLRVGGRCLIAGATNEGIKSAATTLETLFGSGRVLAKDRTHHVIVAVKQSEEPASRAIADNPFVGTDAFHELTATLRGTDLTLFSRPGVFSWDHLDEATSILADAMTVNPGERVLDLGCGTGPLGIVASRLSLGAPVTLLDADAEAVRSAERSVKAAGIENARVLTSDIADAVLDETFDVVVTNPPFHIGKSTDLDVPLQFIEDAWAVLADRGRLYLVANRTLPYERAIFQRFGNIETVHDGRRFKVLSAVRARG